MMVFDFLSGDDRRAKNYMIRVVTTMAGIVYPSWSLIYQYALPGVVDPVSDRLLISIYAVVAIALTFLPSAERITVPFLYVGMLLTWLQLVNISYNNNFNPYYQVGIVVLTAVTLPFYQSIRIIAFQIIISGSVLIYLLRFAEFKDLIILYSGCATVFIGAIAAFAIRLFLMERIKQNEIAIEVSKKVHLEEVAKAAEFERLNAELKNEIHQKNHVYQQLEKVFFPHQIVLIKSGKNLEETMPIGEREACVISFDVISSSNIKHEGFADAMEAFFSKCRELMMDGYDENQFLSAGYMIKEMGDGFLCSVGFPFKQPSGFKSQFAVDLAEKMVFQFIESTSLLNTRQHILCSVGIARGMVRSYFSRSGRIRDDLWGPAIMLATRYEGMRRTIFETQKIEPSCIITLQESVYESISPERRAEFTLLNLQSAQIKVRDDPSATSLAFKLYRKLDSHLEKAG